MHDASLTHVWFGLALAAIALGLALLSRGPQARRRFRLTMWIAAVALVIHGGLMVGPWLAPYGSQLYAIERLLLALSIIHGLITLAFNSVSAVDGHERAPAIVQNALVFGLFGLVSTVAFPGQLLATSAVGAVIMGFALQDTLSNFFAGLALQIDRPFKPGHWIEVGPFQGRVVDITWRATKIQTKQGNLIVVPNNIVGKEAINNYSEPAAPTRLFVEVGAAYGTPPNEVRDAMLAAMKRCGRVLATPAADVVVMDFGASAIVYHARFWVNDFSQDARARDEVRTAIYYEFHRRQIEIPWPIQIEYSREEQPRDTPARREDFARRLAAVPILAPLDADAHRALAAEAVEHLFARGETIVHEGAAGASMFVVLEGRVAIVIGPEAREVAVTEAGGYFGEMSLLTGDARTASVVARVDTKVLELSAEAFGAWVRSRPETLQAIAAVAEARRRELDEARAGEMQPVAAVSVSLLDRMRRFFHL
jgi:small-conductance mechanosensitive channel/CRP-like cAMP-binding protein